ncbi:MAG: ABC transporter permease [Thermomicrobiales bacterium]
MTQQLPQGLAPEISGERGQPAFGDVALRWGSRHARILAPLTTFVCMFIFFSFATDVFLTTRNLQNIVTQIGPVAVAATGVTFVLLCAEIDLSIGSVATLSGVIAAALWVGERWPHLSSWGMLAAIVAAIFLGLVNGFLVAYIGIPSFMMTLAMLTIAHGLSVYVSEGKPIGKVPPVLSHLGGAGDKILGIPVVGIVALAVLGVGEVVLSYTRFGRYVYMTGGNREAAEMSGVNTRRVIMTALTICAFTACLSGMLFVGRLHSANPSAGGDLLLQTVAAVVLGGTSLFGGEGGIKNTIIGLCIFGILNNGLNLLPNISFYFKEALQGIILLAALLLNVLALRLEKVQTRTE